LSTPASVDSVEKVEWLVWPFGQAEVSGFSAWLAGDKSQVAAIWSGNSHETEKSFENASLQYTAYCHPRRWHHGVICRPGRRLAPENEKDFRKGFVLESELVRK